MQTRVREARVQTPGATTPSRRVTRAAQAPSSWQHINIESAENAVIS